MQILINQAENAWLSSLYSNAEQQFSEAYLPSHDHSHHLRVWYLCKELLLEISGFNSSLDLSLVEGVLISAFFHDLGMALSSREDHGALGKELCLSWFREGNRARPDRFEEILEAIEHHDVKEKGSYAKIRAAEAPRILTLLSMADDMEAFGTIGIYRYAEIYLMRKIPLSQLGDRILVNAEGRFHNLMESCKLCPVILEKHRKGYEILRNFYITYNRQLQGEPHPERIMAGHLGVINYIRILGMEEQILPEHFPDFLENGENFVKSYFRTLKNELDQASI